MFTQLAHGSLGVEKASLLRLLLVGLESGPGSATRGPGGSWNPRLRLGWAVQSTEAWAGLGVC